MKRILFLSFIVIALLQSCVIRPYNPPYPPPPPPGGQPWWYTESNNNDTNDNVPNNGNPNGTNQDNDNQNNSNDNRPTTPQTNGNDNNTTGDEGVDKNFVPAHRYDSAVVDGVLTFNVYLGWEVDQMETVIMLRDFSKWGGEIIFNIYTNNLCMSMYGFEKYRTDFYVFSSEPPYCGYSSYSLDTKSICRYKMIIKENKTNADRYCCGYWACNDCSSFYSSFKIVLYQRF